MQWNALYNCNPLHSNDKKKMICKSYSTESVWSEKNFFILSRCLAFSLVYSSRKMKLFSEFKCKKLKTTKKNDLIKRFFSSLIQINKLIQSKNEHWLNATRFLT